MTTIAKTISAAALAVALALPLAAPVSAGEKAASPAATAESAPIVVRSVSAMKQWQKETTQDLNRALIRNPITRKFQPNNAIVEVAFTLGADGKAENITLIEGRGNWAARRAAAYAVRTLDSLGDVPVVNPSGTPFLARIVFANNEEIKEDLFAEMKKASPARFAVAGAPDEYILLGG